MSKAFNIKYNYNILPYLVLTEAHSYATNMVPALQWILIVGDHGKFGSKVAMDFIRDCTKINH
jgi:hypothetical protein